MTGTLPALHCDKIQFAAPVAALACHAKITISDTGDGSMPDFLAHVVERSRPAAACTTRQRGARSALINNVHSYLSTRLCPTSNFAIVCYTCKQEMFIAGTDTVLAAAN